MATARRKTDVSTLVRHPLGATGGRLLSSLIYELRRTEKKVGVATLCMGTGAGKATLIGEFLTRTCSFLSLILNSFRCSCRVDRSLIADVAVLYPSRSLCPSRKTRAKLSCETVRRTHSGCQPQSGEITSCVFRFVSLTLLTSFIALSCRISISPRAVQGRARLSAPLLPPLSFLLLSPHRRADVVS